MKQKKHIIVTGIATLFLLAALGFSLSPLAQRPFTIPPVNEPFGSASPLLIDSDFDCEGCNVVIVGMTNVRRDHMGLYGYSRDTTPNIDAFAKRSVVFENAFSPTSWTLPVVASILTSLYPFQHGVMSRTGKFGRLGDEFITLTDVLRQNGYRTASFTGGGDLSPIHGITSRFDEAYYPAPAGLAHQTAGPQDPLGLTIDTKDIEQQYASYGSFADTVPRATDWMASHKDNPFFTYVQGFDAHCPFTDPKINDRFTPGLHSDLDYSYCYWTFDETAPVVIGGKTYFNVLFPARIDGKLQDDPPSRLISEEDVQYMTALFDGEVNLVDGYVGQLLDSMEREGLLENTMVILLAEHGEMLGKHGRFMRGGILRGTFYDDVLHVPLSLYFPKNRQQGIHRPQIMELTDLAPTILDALSFESPSQFVGHSVREISTSDAQGGQKAFAGSMFFPDSNRIFNNATMISSLRTPEWKLIYEDIFKPIPNFDKRPLSSFLDPAKEDVEVRTQLFDMKNDPEELTDVSAQHPDIAESLRKEMDLWIKGSQ